MQADHQDSKRKKVKSPNSTPQVRMFDTQTGEMLDEGVTIHIPRKLRIKGFFMASQLGFDELAKSNLTGEAFKVLMLMVDQLCDLWDLTCICSGVLGRWHM